LAVESCRKTWNDYLRLETQLLPPGYAWDWSPSSVGKHLLAAYADEFARVHNHLCELADAGIARFSGEITGWSAPDYERLLLDKFGITAVVSDGLEPYTCESSCEAPLLDERIVYAYIVTVDNVADVPDTALTYLREYQQSHTHHFLRDNQLTASTRYDYAAFDCESACDAAVYDRDWHGVELYADGTYPTHELNTLPAWSAIASQLRDYTDIYRGTHALTQ
jgi:uncharacterized protein YmfQ (DUF2313 family)